MPHKQTPGERRCKAAERLQAALNRYSDIFETYPELSEVPMMMHHKTYAEGHMREAAELAAAWANHAM
jgi:hypothetical protein